MPSYRVGKTNTMAPRLCADRDLSEGRAKARRLVAPPVTHFSKRISTYQACHLSRLIINNVLSIERVLLNTALNNGVLLNGTHNKVVNP